MLRLSTLLEDLVPLCKMAKAVMVWLSRNALSEFGQLSVAEHIVPVESCASQHCPCCFRYQFLRVICGVLIKQLGDPGHETLLRL